MCMPWLAKRPWRVWGWAAVGRRPAASLGCGQTSAELDLDANVTRPTGRARRRRAREGRAGAAECTDRCARGPSPIEVCCWLGQEQFHFSPAQKRLRGAAAKAPRGVRGAGTGAVSGEAAGAVPRGVPPEEPVWSQAPSAETGAGGSRAVHVRGIQSCMRRHRASVAEQPRPGLHGHQATLPAG